MFKVLAATALVALVGVFAGTANTATTFKVQSVYDGDTLTLTNGQRVRLLQIDTAEIKGNECFAKEARTALRNLTLGKTVKLVADPKLDNKDRYGRLLRYVFVQTRNVNVTLVKAGFAAPYFYRGERGKYSSTLYTLAKSAKASSTGLWGFCDANLDPVNALTTNYKVTTPPVETTPVTPPPATSKCDPGYAGCVPLGPPNGPDLDCADIKRLGLAPVKVIGVDSHKLDRDGDGIGCDS